MEIICAKASIYSAIQNVEKIVSARSTLPIVGNILLEALNGTVKISANNLEMGIEIKMGAEVKKEGAILIPAKTFIGIVAKLPDENINIATKEREIIQISYKKAKFNINGLPADEFPVLPKITKSKEISIDAQVFSDMVKHTIFSASTSEEKFVLNGVVLETGKSVKNGDSNIRMAATDGFRLARTSKKIKDVDDAGSVIIPSKALNEIMRILQNKEGGLLSIIISNEQIAFEYNDIYFVSRLIQGQFPNYKQVIPKESEVKIIVKTKEALEAAERAAVIASGSANIIRINIADGNLNISANTPDVGNIEENVAVEATGNLRAPIALNVRLLTDALKSLGSEKISLEFSGPLSPCVIKPLDTEDYLYIVMPIRTTDTEAAAA